MKRSLLLILSVVIVVLLALFSLVSGECGLPVVDVLTGGVDVESAEWMILTKIRLPRVMMAIGCGALLSIAGAVMQAVFRNPLVEPYTMGLSGGAVVGVGLAWVMGVSGAYSGVFAFIGALVSMLLVLSLRRLVGSSVEVMLLAGVVVSFAMSSVSTLLFAIADREAAFAMTYWNIGSFAAVNDSFAYYIFFLAWAVIFSTPFAGRLIDVISAGEMTASHVGIDSRKLVVVLFCISALLTSICVCNAGIIAFVGLVVPHVIRRLVGGVHRWVLPLCGILGGAFLLACDVLAQRLMYPSELPVGIFTGIFGGAFFVVVLIRERSKGI